MHYGVENANDMHITNVSGNETPELITTVSEWLYTVPSDLKIVLTSILRSLINISYCLDCSLVII